MENEIIIQIFALPAAPVDGKHYLPVLYGLSNKGRLFSKAWAHSNWELLNSGVSDIPDNT